VNLLRRMCLVLPLVLVVLVSARAGSKTDTVYFNGHYAFGDHGVGIPPYEGTLNGKAADFYCVDFTHDITAGMTWTVYGLNLTSKVSAFGSTLLKNKTEYLEMAWLITQMEAATTQTMKAEYQWAVWSFTGGVTPSSYSESVSTFTHEALTAVDDGYNGKGWEILTPTGAHGQEFLVDPPLVSSTPEPSSMLLFGTGLIGLSFAIRKKWPAKNT
jgi:hypothetical protein